jgi:hypothetical protein
VTPYSGREPCRTDEEDYETYSTCKHEEKSVPGSALTVRIRKGKEEATEKKANHQPHNGANQDYRNYLGNFHSGSRAAKPLPIINNQLTRHN